jgi:hypothetical protein
MSKVESARSYPKRTKAKRVPPTPRPKGVAINDDPALEREADAVGAQAVQASRKAGASGVER